MTGYGVRRRTPRLRRRSRLRRANGTAFLVWPCWKEIAATQKQRGKRDAQDPSTRDVTLSSTVHRARVHDEHDPRRSSTSPSSCYTWARSSLFSLIMIPGMPHPQGSARESQSLQDDGARLEYARPSLPIPEELLREILHYIVPGPSFSTGECRKMDAALSQTCRLFASVAIPRLFHDLHVHCHSDSDDITPGWLQLVRTGYLDDLLNVSRIASLVQSVRLTSQGFDVPKVGSAIDSLLLLPRLTSMTLDYITVPGRVLDIIAQMKTLRTLSFMECSFLEADRERIRSYATELIVFKCHGYPFEGWTMTEDGMEGPVRAGTLRLLRVTHPTLGGTIIPRRGTFPKLEEVEIHLGKYPLLSETLRGLLEEIPTLKILRLIFYEPAPPSFLDIKANLPRLSVVACPAWMLSLMGPLHAISTLDIGPPLLDTSADLLERLAAKNLFAQLKELSLDSRLLPLAGSALKSARRIAILAIKVVGDRPAFDDVSVYDYT
jgi:hypothetical protein